MLIGPHWKAKLDAKYQPHKKVSPAEAERMQLAEMPSQSREAAVAFIQFLRSNGATVTVNDTKRSFEEGFLIYWVYMIGGRHKAIPQSFGQAILHMDGTKLAIGNNIGQSSIKWELGPLLFDHGNADATQKACEKAIKPYFNIDKAETLNSGHLFGGEIDMTIRGLPAKLKLERNLLPLKGQQYMDKLLADLLEYSQRKGDGLPPFFPPAQPDRLPPRFRIEAQKGPAPTRKHTTPILVPKWGIEGEMHYDFSTGMVTYSKGLLERATGMPCELTYWVDQPYVLLHMETGLSEDITVQKNRGVIMIGYLFFQMEHYSFDPSNQGDNPHWKYRG